MAKKTPKEENALVIDAGIFTFVAEALAKEFARTLYYCEWRSAFPLSKVAMIGEGMAGVERTLDLWKSIQDSIDLVIIPDVVLGSLGDFIVDYLGIPVFGTRQEASQWELDRWGFRDVLRKVRLPLTDAVRIIGTEDLRSYLEKEPEKYVKYGYFRGDMETFHHREWRTTEIWFDDLVYRLGPRTVKAEFVVEEPIEGIEIGIDTFVVDGEFPDLIAYGYELKGSAYVGQIVPWKDLPKPLVAVAERLKPELKRVKHRGWISIEVRVTKDGIPYVIDPCMRCASPPTEALIGAYENWGEIISKGARGTIVAPKPKGRYIAEVVISSEFAREHFLPVIVPEGEAVRFHDLTIVDGQSHIVPTDDMNIGSAAGIGDSLDAAQRACDNAAGSLEAHQANWDKHAWEELSKTIEEGKEAGIPWE